MPSLSQIITAFPETQLITAKALLHLGTRAAVDQALSRMARAGVLQRASRGVYFRPIVSRFGSRGPAPAELATALGAQRGETIAPHGAAAANSLGLTTQVPMREIFWTTGRRREIKLGAQTVEFRHVPNWQLLHAGTATGTIIRALAWAGRGHVAEAIETLKPNLAPAERAALLSARPALPAWMAQAVSVLSTQTAQSANA